MMRTIKVILLSGACAFSACQSDTYQKTDSETATSNSTNKEHTDDNVMGSRQMVRNRKIVDDAFNNWVAGKGIFFDLLDENVVWRVTGKAPFLGVYRSKQEFMEKAVTPINDFLSTSIKPELIDINASGNVVWLQWKGAATTITGGQYINEYAWKLTFNEKGKITAANAFLDTYSLSKLVKK